MLLEPILELNNMSVVTTKMVLVTEQPVLVIKYYCVMVICD